MQDVGGQMDGVERHVFGRRPVAAQAKEAMNAAAASKPTQPAACLRVVLARQDRPLTRRRARRASPVFAEMRVRQDDPDDAILQDRGQRHPAHVRCDDEQPNDAACERDEQTHPRKREEPPIEPFFERVRSPAR